jgi:ABC-type multidrug transport system fused ATPase/permease subunit
LEEKDYPLLFQESDSKALEAQKNYFRLVFLKISFLIIIALITSINWAGESIFRTPIAIALAMVMVFSISLTAIMSIRHSDENWLFSRKMAEEIKTATWKYMMKVGDYQGSLPDKEAEKIFLKNINEIIHNNSKICSQLNLVATDVSQITEHMKKIRKNNLKNRMAYYHQERIYDQRCWYANKAKWNRHQEVKWFTLTWLLELVAVSIALVNIVMVEMVIQPVSAVLAAGGGVLSWVNARSYKEPAESYGIISNELALLEEQARNVADEEGFNEIVKEVENLIMKEHYIWLSRLI